MKRFVWKDVYEDNEYVFSYEKTSKNWLTVNHTLNVTNYGTDVVSYTKTVEVSRFWNILSGGRIDEPLTLDGNAGRFLVEGRKPYVIIGGIPLRNKISLPLFLRKIIPLGLAAYLLWNIFGKMFIAAGRSDTVVVFLYAASVLSFFLAAVTSVIFRISTKIRHPALRLLLMSFYTTVSVITIATIAVALTLVLKPY